MILLTPSLSVGIMRICNISTASFLARLFEEYGELLQSLLRRRRRWFWLKFCVQGLFFVTMYAIALKLHTLIRSDHMTWQDKSHNSRLNSS